MFYAEIFTNTNKDGLIFLGKSPIEKDDIGYRLYIYKEFYAFSESGMFEIRLPKLFAAIKNDRLIRIIQGSTNCIRQIESVIIVSYG